MKVTEIIYNLIFAPIELLFEFVFSISNQFLNNSGLSIIVLSLAMNFLVLPLYKRADAMQNEEKLKEQEVRPLADHIKKYFKGDERFMMLQTHYKQHNYSPFSILKSSVSLLLQIPFFIAAYNMINNLSILQGVSFGIIEDLSKPDGLINIGNISLNLLPILMTAINIISGVIYTRGMPARNKVQLYGVAAIFLILLYNSPSGLVFYWTLNNVFSLMKNIFYKLKNPKLTLDIILSIVGIIVTVLAIVNHISGLSKTIIVIGFVMALELPIVLYFAKKSGKSFNKSNKIPLPEPNIKIFFLGGLILSLLTGVLIPTNVIKSSPEEFINIIELSNPLKYIAYSFSLAVGTFIIWFGVYYLLANKNGRRIQECILLLLIGNGIVNYFILGQDKINMNSKLVYDKLLFYSGFVYSVSIILTVTLVLLFYFIWRGSSKVIKPVYSIIALSLVFICSLNCYNINKNVSNKLEEIKINSATQELASIPLSKDGKNVIVLMMDRAISSYVPYIFNEKPELLKQYDGFTYYPNTISYGGSTNYGSPGLYGGYEYTPKKINERPNESLESKQNEALKVMPVVFDNNGYEVTVCDPSYAGYDWIPDLSIYDDYPNIRTFNTYGKFNPNPVLDAQVKDHALKRNFYCHALFKISPYFMKNVLYDDGTYNEPGKYVFQKAESFYEANGISDDFVNAYSVLQNLPNITYISDKSTKGTFLMMSNDTTHNPMMLQEPEYEPKYHINNKDYYRSKNINGHKLNMSNTFQLSHYESNMAAAIKLGVWFDYLRGMGVYDNTKIIIVSDHGYNLGQREDMILNNSVDIMQYNAFLMVKDFNSTGFKTDNAFMTNCDTPTIAMSGLIENPKNPYTHCPINNSMKDEPLKYVYYGGEWNININNGNTFEPNSWLTVKDDVFDMNQWQIVN